MSELVIDVEHWHVERLTRSIGRSTKQVGSCNRFFVREAVTRVHNSRQTVSVAGSNR